MTMITPSAQLTLTKGNKSWSSTAVAAALELVDPLGSGPWLSLTAPLFFFFFFFNHENKILGLQSSSQLHIRIETAEAAGKILMRSLSRALKQPQRKTASNAAQGRPRGMLAGQCRPS
eukprot:FR734797.1.p1 GENE.FR734797.1~~FR734797.1.p1  ORF type:complete len:118 (-),score=22.97 FR734797.1:196-549(-)